jgi:bacteriorhodopsin
MLIARLIGYYTFWLFAWLLIGYSLLWTPRRYASALGSDIKRVHTTTAGWLWFLWMLYPICWGVSEGGNVIAPNSEFIFYGILDCLLIPCTSAFFLLLHRDVDPARLGLRMRSYDDPIGTHAAVRAEEKAGATNGHTNGHAETNDAAQPASTV